MGHGLSRCLPQQIQCRLNLATRVQIPNAGGRLNPLPVERAGVFAAAQLLQRLAPVIISSRIVRIHGQQRLVFLDGVLQIAGIGVLLDLFIANDKMDNSFFHNRGGGRFEEMAFDAGVALAENGRFISGIGVDFRDLDNDGLPDIVFAALDNETFPLFRNLGKRGFADITGSSGMARLSVSMAGYSPTIADFDNDGWKDIFVTRGHVQSLGYASRVQVEQPNTIFRNMGGARFEALTAEAGLTARPPSRHRGSAVGDLNGDGRLDVVTTAIGAPAELWFNDSPGGGHWLAFELRGTTSNRDGGTARRPTHRVSCGSAVGAASRD